MSQTETVGIVLLAAGSGRRFGSDKRCARMADGDTLLEHSLRLAVDSGLPVLLCIPPAFSALPPAAATPQVTIHRATHCARGMGATLAGAMSAIDHWTSALVTLADMPWVKPGTLQRVAASAGATTIVVPSYQGTPGHPVAFGAIFFPELAALDGDRGGRALLEAHPEAMHTLAVDDPGILRDIDRPGDLMP